MISSVMEMNSGPLIMHPQMIYLSDTAILKLLEQVSTGGGVGWGGEGEFEY